MSAEWTWNAVRVAIFRAPHDFPQQRCSTAHPDSQVSAVHALLYWIRRRDFLVFVAINQTVLRAFFVVCSARRARIKNGEKLDVPEVVSTRGAPQKNNFQNHSFYAIFCRWHARKARRLQRRQGVCVTVHMSALSFPLWLASSTRIFVRRKIFRFRYYHVWFSVQWIFSFAAPFQRAQDKELCSWRALSYFYLLTRM